MKPWSCRVLHGLQGCHGLVVGPLTGRRGHLVLHTPADAEHVVKDVPALESEGGGGDPIIVTAHFEVLLSLGIISDSVQGRLSLKREN